MIKFPHIIEISLNPFNPLNVGSMIPIKTHICQFIFLFLWSEDSINIQFFTFSGKLQQNLDLVSGFWPFAS